MASVGALWGPATLRLLRVVAANTAKTVRHKLTSAVRPGVQGEAQQVSLRTGYTGRQPIHPSALLKQQKNGAGWFSGAGDRNVHHAVRQFFGSLGPGGHAARSRLPASKTSRRVAQFSGRAPFANALRPNLTGGAIPRTAGGYSLGGGARYFSHTPTASAQVVQNVSQAMRAFFISGQKLRYDGVGPNGERRYRATSTKEYEAIKKMQATPHFAPGTYVDFRLSPIVTALSPFCAAAASSTLNTDGLLDILSADFGRALKDLTATYADLRSLAVLGDLPITMESQDTIRVRFPGVDLDTVERLCDDLGVQRGIVKEDAGFGFGSTVGAPVALRFPFAPQSEHTLTSPGGSRRSVMSEVLDEDSSSLGDDSFVYQAFAQELAQESWSSHEDEFASLSPPLTTSKANRSDEPDGLEGILRFLEECDRAKNMVF